MRRLFQRLIGREKTYVGEDYSGNKYYIVQNPEKKEPQRGVEYVGEDISTTNLPPVWRSWLHRRRDITPTYEEMMTEKVKMEQFQQRVRQVEELDLQMRKQEILEGMEHKEVAPDVDYFMRKVLAKSDEEEKTKMELKDSEPKDPEQK